MRAKQNGVVNLADVALAGPMLRRSLKDISYATGWVDLVRHEPGLSDFLLEVRSFRGVDYESCPLMGWATTRGRLERFVGSDTPAYYAAYDALVDAQRPCRHCLDRELAEADIEADIARMLALAGERPQRQVGTKYGIADIVTEGAVYEVKLWLTRHALLSAIGQVSLYWVALGDEARRRVIVGQVTPETAALVPGIDQLGIDVEVW